MIVNQYSWSSVSKEEFDKGGYNGAEVVVFSQDWARISVYHNQMFMGAEVSPEAIIELRDFLNTVIERMS